jgi:sec-independent protein translocase protein TatA
MYPLIGDVGTPELLIIFVVILLVFGGAKLPDLARGSGRAIRIFKEEVGKTDDDVASSSTAEPVQAEAVQEKTPPTD